MNASENSTAKIRAIIVKQCPENYPIDPVLRLANTNIWFRTRQDYEAKSPYDVCDLLCKIIMPEKCTALIVIDNVVFDFELLFNVISSKKIFIDGFYETIANIETIIFLTKFNIAETSASFKSRFKVVSYSDLLNASLPEV